LFCSHEAVKDSDEEPQNTSLLDTILKPKQKKDDLKEIVLPDETKEEEQKAKTEEEKK